MGAMASPDRPDEGHIADTGMFQRFVAHEQEMEQREPDRSAPRWALPTAIVLFVVLAAIVVWLLVR